MRAIKIGMSSLALMGLLWGAWGCQSGVASKDNQLTAEQQGPTPENKKRPVTSDQPNPNAVKMPDFKFTTLADKLFTPKDLKKQKTVFFFFSALCHHCQANAKALVKRADEFKDVQVVLISTETLKIIKQFGKDYGLDKFPNYQLMHIDEKDVFDTFGQILTPSVFIFNRHHEMTEKFIGNTFFDYIVDHIPA